MRRLYTFLLHKYPWKKHALCVAPLLLAVAAMFLVIGNEKEIAVFFRGLRTANPLFTRVVDFYVDFGNIGFYLFYGLLLCLAVWKSRCAHVNLVVGYVVGLIVSALLVECAKSCVGRPRPYIDGDFKPFSPRSGYQSFPSGHVNETFATVAPLAMHFGNTLVPVLLGLSPLLMGMSRVYLGKHHPTDLLGSVASSLVAAWLAWFIARRLALYRRGTRRGLVWLRRCLSVCGTSEKHRQALLHVE